MKYSQPASEYCIILYFEYHNFLIHFNIIVLSTSKFPNWYPLFRFPNQGYMLLISHSRYTTRPFHHSWFHHPDNTWRRPQITQRLLVYFSLSSSYFHCEVHAFYAAVCSRTYTQRPTKSRFPAPVQTDPGAHPASYTVDTGSLSQG